MFRRLHKDQSGQVMAFIALVILALIMFWMIVVNLGTLERERIRMQNAVDAATITAVRYQARALNIIGQLNNAQCAFGVPYFTHYCKYGQMALRAIVQAQVGINRAYGGGWAFLKAREVARANGADELININPSGMFSLKLKRNKGLVIYWGHVVWIPTPVGPVPVYLPCTIHGLIDKNTDRWYERTWSSQQPPHTLSFIATKGAKEAPVGGELLGVDIPGIQTIAKGQTWLNSSSGYGLPGKGSWYGFSYPLVFDAKLMPVTGMQH